VRGTASAVPACLCGGSGTAASFDHRQLTRRHHVAASARTGTRRRARASMATHGVFAGLPLPTPAALPCRITWQRQSLITLLLF